MLVSIKVFAQNPISTDTFSLVTKDKNHAFYVLMSDKHSKEKDLTC